jgi:fused signal recognition particle receptor
MFGSLKEKLKNWTTKVKEEVFGKEEKPKKETKKTKKKQDKTKKDKTPKKTEKKQKSEKTSKKKTKKEFPKKEVIEKDLQKKTEEPIQEIIEEEVQEETIEEPEQVQEETIPEETEEEPKEKKGFFSGFFKKELTEEKFQELFQELELTLLQNNVAYSVVETIKEKLKEKIVGKKDYNLEKELKEIIKEILIESKGFIKQVKDSLKEKKPFVISLVGINGSGKTTTIAKLAHLLQKNKLSVCLAAGDTYRAASIEQLEVHAKNLNIPTIKKDYGSDPASVGFEAIQYAKKHSIDVVLIDTAGRLNNKENLMKELEKIIKVTNPDMKIFVGESTTGNDATEQAKNFDELINLTGIILSKADVDEKGGTMISVGYITKKPILFLGTGQAYDDLEEFDKERVIKNLGL